ncbi:MAG: hypothetical protein AAB421_02605 [Patescibacteria group bacterium]
MYTNVTRALLPAVALFGALFIATDAGAQCAPPTPCGVRPVIEVPLGEPPPAVYAVPARVGPYTVRLTMSPANWQALTASTPRAKCCWYASTSAGRQSQTMCETTVVALVKPGEVYGYCGRAGIKDIWRVQADGTVIHETKQCRRSN